MTIISISPNFPNSPNLSKLSDIQPYNHRAIEPFQSLSQTRVTLRKMTDSEIKDYVNHYDLRRFAASYALNDTPWNLITKIDGSYTNVIGLPFEELIPVLKKFDLLKTKR